MDVALRVADRLGHRRQRVLAVDQHLERVAVARRDGGLRPQALARRRERRELPMAAQSPHVVMDHRALDAVPYGGVDAGQDSGPPCLHAYPLASQLNMASDQPTPQRLAAIREQMSLLSDYL